MLIIRVVKGRQQGYDDDDDDENQDEEKDYDDHEYLEDDETRRSRSRNLSEVRAGAENFENGRFRQSWTHRIRNDRIENYGAYIGFISK